MISIKIPFIYDPKLRIVCVLQSKFHGILINNVEKHYVVNDVFTIDTAKRADKQ